jgi:phosphatidylglycerophosphate synthase
MTDRRPLASRDTGWARMLTRKLVATDITPNQISIASIGFAAVAGIGFFIGPQTSGFGGTIALLVAALCCQLRLICNLLDGMVAIEGGKSSPDGAYWNEAPDRISDVLILVGLGLGVGLPGLGWAAAAMAVGTAYIRELGRATDGVNDFSGPLAKPHRMAVLTIAAVLACFVPLWGGTGLGLLTASLWLILLGSAATSLRRSAALLARLRAHN